jgi:hypothetical protein
LLEENVEQNVEENIAPEVEERSEPPSIRDSLASALEESKAKQVEGGDVKIDKTRDEAGKFIKEDKVVKFNKTQKSSQNNVPRGAIEGELESVPQGLSAIVKSKWAQLPTEVRQEFVKREADFHKELTKHDEERIDGRFFRETTAPYLPVIKAEGGDIKTAFQNFLNTAYVLRTKSPQEKGQLLLKLAKEFGADLRGASQPQSNGDPRYNQLTHEVQTLKSTLNQQIAAQKQQEDKAIHSTIDAFAADPKNIHFETVKPHMAALLRGGMAKDMQDAYDQAVYANPQTRSTLLQQQNAESDEKRLAEKKAKAEQARRAGSSLRGAPGIAATKNGRIVQPDLRSELKAQFAAYREA